VSPQPEAVYQLARTLIDAHCGTILYVERLSVAHCRILIPTPLRTSLADKDIEALRDSLYELAGIVTDAFSDLEGGEPDLESRFDPPGFADAEHTIRVLEKILGEEN
jgi:hypothetical protein